MALSLFGSIYLRSIINHLNLFEMFCKILLILFLSFSSSAFCAEDSLDVLSSTIPTVLTPLKNSLLELVTSWFPLLFQIGCAFLIFYLGRVVFAEVKSFANMAALPSDDCSDDFLDDLDSDDFEDYLEEDGLYYVGDMVFDDYNDYLDFVRIENDPDFEVGYREWYENTYG